MHVHANYSQQLASLGPGRNDTQEIAARRAAEVRKNLSASGRLLSENGEEVLWLTPGTDERQDSQRRERDDEEFCQLFSARA